ncbi:MAG: Bifunctional protein GlmU [Eubacteriales bacterium SKADARSKE-1]|nr:Bifunctional protein GlmU [Eubacteriales bacterium SKADARSKE-1]
MLNTCSIILAAGDGKRMKTERPKVLSEVLFRPMIKWVVDALNEAGINNICAVCGYKHEILEKYINNFCKGVETATQQERRGTAHAVIMADNFLKRNLKKDVLIVGGDTPFIDPNTIIESLQLHRSQNNVATIISAKVNNPFGFGRIVRNIGNNKILSIVEQKDADEETRLITEVNSGAYWFNIEALLSVIYDISNNNAQNEFYLPDAIAHLLSKGLPVDAYVVKNEEIILGANDHVQLNALNKIAREKVLEKLMLGGVDIPLKDGIIIEGQVEVGPDTCILPGTIVRGKSSIGSGCIIGPNSTIINSHIEDSITLISTYCDNCRIKRGEKVSPFSVIY